MPESDAQTVLVTGGAGFLGSSLVKVLLVQSSFKIRLLARQKSKARNLIDAAGDLTSRLEIIEGNLLSPPDCAAAVDGVSIIYHLAAGTGTKSFPDAFRNSVVTTRNLIEAALVTGKLTRFVNTSTFAVYTNRGKPRRNVLAEDCPVDFRLQQRGEAYAYAKFHQDQLVKRYGETHGLRYVIVRPGMVYGPGKPGITSSRIGIHAFGRFFHLGGRNRLPLTFRDNCAEAIYLAGTTPGIEQEVFNIVDDDLPTSRTFLRQYQRSVERLRSIYVPRLLLYLACVLWEKYSIRSHEQLPPMYNRSTYYANWKRTKYSNAKLKQRTGWKPRVSTRDGMAHFFASCLQK